MAPKKTDANGSSGNAGNNGGNGGNGAAGPAQDLTTVGMGSLPAELQQELQQDAGKGVSTLSRDNIIPMIYVLQPLSPQVNERNQDTYIDGAKPGFFWLRNSPVPVVSGDEGLAFQPCHYRRDAVEWIPRDLGGGYVGRFPFATPDEGMDQLAQRLGLRIVPSEKRNRPPTYWHGDNEVKEVRYHAGLVHGGQLGLRDHPGMTIPFVIPFGGTGHGVSRSWMTSINQHTFPGDASRVLPSFTRLYRLNTKWRKNASGEWAQIAVSDDLGFVQGFPQDLAVYRRGRALHEAIERGEKEFEVPNQGDTTDDGDGAGGGATIDERANRAQV